MKERFGPEFPRGRIAQTVEMKAGQQFGPEKLKKVDVATALNLREDEISNDEWAEIYEFAVNAGAETIQAAATKDMPDVLKPRDVKRIQKRIEENKYGMIPSHDLFHAAEMYRLTKGQSVTARFVELDTQKRYTDPRAVTAELYPVLFLEIGDTKTPLPVALSTPEGREALRIYLIETLPSGEETMEKILMEDAQTPEDRQRQYEAFVESIILINAGSKLKRSVTREEEKQIREAVKDTPEHYKNFAARVFKQEWKQNPRLFLDELLTCIRTKPELRDL